VEIEPAPNLINSDAVFSSDVTAIAAMDGIYIKMRGLSLSVANGGLSLFTGLSGDEIYNTTSSTVYDPFFKDSIPSENTTIQRNFWTEAYTTIYRANAMMEGLNKSTTLTDSLKKQLLGETKVVRSLYYFYLVNLFGDVPLVVTSNYTTNEKMPRTALSQTYQQIITDLIEAENLLKPTYPSAGKARPNKWTATALLARTYLYQKNWLQAEAKASTVINSGPYSLVTNVSNAFLKNSAETIWEIAPGNEASNTVEGVNFNPSSTTVKPTFALTTYLLNGFESGDQRKLNWVKSNTVGGTIYYYPYKYKVRSSATVTEYNIALRLSEQFLIRSEARMQQGNLSGGQADLNVVRSRAGLPNISATTQERLLLAVEQERRVEFFSEWGHRWLDLKRTGRIDAVMSSAKPNWQSFAALYPIPYSQLQLNVFLAQNPGY
jgi:hypothetical protein